MPLAQRIQDACVSFRRGQERKKTDAAAYDALTFMAVGGSLKELIPQVNLKVEFFFEQERGRATGS
jgi:hypothetical protein